DRQLRAQAGDRGADQHGADLADPVRHRFPAGVGDRDGARLRPARLRAGRLPDDRARQRARVDPAAEERMKAAPFEYSRAADIDEACAMLAADDGARVIAGGQTLVPMMVMRLARRTGLIDINRIVSLSYVREDGDGVSIGATTRQCTVERDPLIASRVPLLAKVMPWIGHAATRARGTIGGSLANADPAAEISLVAVMLGATLVYRDGAKTH